MMINTTSANGMPGPINSQPTLPGHQHAKQLTNGSTAAANMFQNGNGQLNLDSSLSEIAIQVSCPQLMEKSQAKVNLYNLLIFFTL